mgnify:CR=1 FL=1|jgi:hypothetical protein
MVVAAHAASEPVPVGVFEEATHAFAGPALPEVREDYPALVPAAKVHVVVTPAVPLNPTKATYSAAVLQHDP